MAFQTRELMDTVQPVEQSGGFGITRTCTGCTHTMFKPFEAEPGNLELLRQQLAAASKG
jgi:hypothetical protein